MTWNQKWKLALAALSTLTSLVMLGLPATAGAAALYPDLRPLPPSQVRLGTEIVNGEDHYVVRLASWMHNAGQGPFELHGTPSLIAPSTFDVRQFIYDDGGGAPQTPLVGTFYFHQAHQHFHFEDFAQFELWTKRDFERAEARNFASGHPLHTSGKVSFCLMDSEFIDGDRVLPEDPIGLTHNVNVPRYGGACTPAEQGISVGWADVYDVFTPGQYVDVGRQPLADGEYVLRIVGDPTNKLYESAGKADSSRESQVANSSTAYITIANGQLAP